MKKYFLLFLISFLFSGFALAHPDHDGNSFLIDRANIVNNTIVLEKTLQQANQNNDLSLKILTVDNLNGSSIIQYCENLARDVVNEKNNQVIVVYNNEYKQINYCQMETDKETITEFELEYILKEMVQPNIARNNLDFALELAVTQIVRASVQDIELKVDPINNELIKQEQNKLIIVLLFVVVLFSWLAACLGRTKSWWLGGVLGFGLGFFIWWISNIAFFMPLFLIVGLVYDYLVSRHYKKYMTCEKGAFWCTADEIERLEEMEQEKKPKKKVVKKRVDRKVVKKTVKKK